MKLINEAPIIKKPDGSEAYVIDPKEKPTGVIFGKFSPWTGPRGHGRLVKFAEEKFGHGNFVIVSPKRKGTDPKVDIFTAEQKQEIIKKANPGVKFFNLDVDSPYNMMMNLVKAGIKRPVWIVGPDRVEEFKKFFKEFGKNSIKEAKEVPDAEKGEYTFITGERATSATLVRKALLANDKAEFMKLTGYNETMWKTMRAMLKKNKVIKEDVGIEFRDFYQSEKGEDLLEGGLAGHLQHPYETLSIDDFLDFYKKLLSGKLETVEKVDGANLFVGFNKKGKVVFARNRSEMPSEDIESKFPLDHPGGDAFRAGFAAIKTALEKLSPENRYKFDLTDDKKNPKNFLNLEVVYGTIPNLIQYSDTDNYVVFHSYQGTPEEDFKTKPKNDKLLKDLAHAIGKVSVKSLVVSYIGTVKDTKKIVEEKTSNWIFKGPIEVPVEKIKKELEAVAHEFENFDEVKQLKNWKDMDEEKRFEVMKALTAKIGSKVLTNLTSMLFSGKRVTDDNHPKAEGLVTNFKGNLLKVTGDFAELNKSMWEPLRNGLDEELKQFNAYIMNFVLQVPGISTVTKTTWQSVKGDPKEFLLKKGSRKVYADPKQTEAKVDVKDIQKHIDATMDNLEKTYNSVSEKNIKKEDILKALRIAGYKLQQFSKEMRLVKTREDLLVVFASLMFGLKD